MMLNDLSLGIVAGTPPEAENSLLGREKSRPPRVLVVDDEALLRWSVGETLGDRGWQVIEGANAQAALVAFPDLAKASGLVFLDVWLPDSEDLQVLAAMRRLSPGTPVILMTAHGTPDVIAEARALGAFAVLAKPFDMTELGPLAERAAVTATSPEPVTIHRNT